MSDLEPNRATPPAPTTGPASQPIAEADRQAAVDRIQQALAEDLIPFDDVDDRFAAIFAAANRAELDAALAGLPPTSTTPPPRAARHLAPGTSFSLIGDTRIGGWIAVGPSMRSIALIGDTLIDLTSADIPPEGVEIQVYNLIGDIKILLPDGARVQVQAIKLIGDNRQRIVAPVAGAPTIKITVVSLICDVVVQSLSQLTDRKLRRYWKKTRSAELGR